jgi:hypothetical protein
MILLKILKDDNVIGLRLGPRRRRGGIIGEESQKGWFSRIILNIDFLSFRFDKRSYAAMNIYGDYF